MYFLDSIASIDMTELKTPEAIQYPCSKASCLILYPYTYYLPKKRVAAPKLPF